MDSVVRLALQRSLGPGFRLDRELGGGGMSEVHLATDLSLGRQVVVKVLPAELSAGASADRFRRVYANGDVPEQPAIRYQSDHGD